MQTDDDIKRTVATRLRELREGAGYENAAKFAPLIGVDAPSLSRMETGKRAISTLTLRRASEVLGVRMDEFFRVPELRAVRLREGDGRRANTDAMIHWAHDLQDDLETVRIYSDGLRA